MILTCNKCSTRFNLDDSLVKEDGSKVRCSVCKHMFTAYPAELQQESDAPPSLIFDADSDDTDSPEAPSSFDIQENDRSLAESDLELEDTGLEMDDTDLELEDDGPEIDDTDLELEDDGPEMGDTDLEIEADGTDLELDESGLESDETGLELEEPAMEMDGFDLEMEDTDLEEDASDLDIDDDFSFEENDTPQTEDIQDSSLTFEDDGIEFDAMDDAPSSLDLEDQSPTLEMDDESDFSSTAPAADDDSLDNESFDADEDFDGIEFEPMDDEPSSLDLEDHELPLEIENETDFNGTDSQADGLSLEDQSLDDDEGFELEFDIEDDAEKESLVMDDDTDAPSLEIDSEPDLEINAPPLEDSKDKEDEEMPPPVITPDDDFSEYDDVLAEDAEPEDDTPDEKTIEIDDTPDDKKTVDNKTEPVVTTPKRSRRRKKKPLVGAPVLVLLLIFLLVIGAYIASTMTGYKIPYISDIKIPFIEQYLKKTVPETTEVKPVPNQKSVNGRFVTNATAGTLFVITGRVENPSGFAMSHIQIKGALITKDKTEAKTKTAFCGNVITEEMLKTGNISDINKRLSVKTGNHNANVNVKPGASVAFMVVFSDLPEKLQNFTVKVIGFEKTKNN